MKAIDFELFSDEHIHYPSEELLEYLRTVNYTNSKDFINIVNIIRNVWWPSFYSDKLPITKKEDHYEIIFITSGWSGNEDIIEAIMYSTSFQLLMLSYTYERGGKYIIRIPL